MVLINGVVLAALENWVEAEQDGKGWNPDGGATLNSWFVTGCLFAFPNEFGKWQTTERWRRDEHVAADLSADVSDIEAELLGEHRRSRMFRSPEMAAVLIEQVELALAMLKDDEERAIVKLKALGYPIEEITEVVGKPPAEIKNFLKRLKRRNIGSQMEGNQDG